MQNDSSSEDLANNTPSKSKNLIKTKTRKVITKHTTTVTDIDSKQKELQNEINSKLKDFQTKIEDENKTKAEEAEHLVNNVSNWNSKITDTKKDLEEITKLLAANNQRRLSKISAHSHSHSRPASIASSGSVSVTGSRIPDSLYRPLTESGVDKKLLKQLDKFFHKREHDLKAQILNMHNQKKQNRLLKKCFLSWYNDMKNEKEEKNKENDEELIKKNDLENSKNKENIKKLTVTLLTRNIDNMYKRIMKQAFNKWIKLLQNNNNSENNMKKKTLEKTEITMTYESKPIKFQNYCTEYNALVCDENNDLENENNNRNREIDLQLEECDVCDLIDDNNYDNNNEDLEYIQYQEIVCEDKNEYEDENENKNVINDTVDNISFSVIKSDNEIKNPKFHNEICNKIPADMKVEEVDISFVTTASLSIITLYLFLFIFNIIFKNNYHFRIFNFI